MGGDGQELGLVVGGLLEGLVRLLEGCVRVGKRVGGTLPFLLGQAALGDVPRDLGKPEVVARLAVDGGDDHVRPEAAPVLSDAPALGFEAALMLGGVERAGRDTGGAILFAIAGAGIAPIYPTVMALIAKRYPKGTDTAITFTVTLMGIASVIGKLLIGFIIDGVRRLFSGESGGGGDATVGNASIIGLQAGYGFIALMALLCSVCCAILLAFLRKQGREMNELQSN